MRADAQVALGAALGLVACASACAFHPEDVPTGDGAAPLIDGAVVDRGSIFDGAVPDAPLPDARRPDAPVIDARPPDAPPAANTCAPGTPGLLACWDFEGNGTDGTGHGNNATLENVSFGAGHRGMGLVTSAAGQSRAFVATSSDFNVTGGVTIEAWFRADQVPAVGGGAGARVGLFDTDGQWGIFIYPSGFDAGGMVRCSISGGSTFFAGTITAGVTYHVACTYDAATGRSFLYLDQVAVGVAANTPAPIVPAATSSAIASDAVCLTAPCANTLTGMIDEVRIWNYARSGADIGAP